MSETVHVEAARIPDRDRLLRTLVDGGVEARAVDEIGIEVPIDDASDGLADRLYAQVEALVLELGEPFVPTKKDGTIYLRPPGD